MSSHKYYESAVRKLKNTLGDQKTVAIVGWKDSNHSELTRSIKSTGRVVFIEKITDKLPQNVGYAIATRFLGHSDFKRMSASSEMTPNIFTIGVIRRILDACRDAIFELPTQMTEPQVVVVQLITQEQAPLQFTEVTTQQSEVFEMVELSAIEKFASMFLGAASTHPEVLVSVRMVADMREKCGVLSTAQQLVRQGVLEQVTAPGKTKVGWYRAGPNIRKQTEEVVSSDPVVRARALIAKEPELLAELDELKQKVSEVTKQLNFVNSAKEKLKLLEDLFK